MATTNSHKLQEIRKILPGSFTISMMSEKGITGDIPETGSTFEENALLKAWFLYERLKCISLADDSGLEVDALGGRPGIFSARYAGPEANSSGNMNKLLGELNGVSNRSARFRTVLALVLGGKAHTFEGVVEGTIAQFPRGEGGFGYDPIFIPRGEVRSFAEMTASEKNSMSHRALAVVKLKLFLEDYMKTQI